MSAIGASMLHAVMLGAQRSEVSLTRLQAIEVAEIGEGLVTTLRDSSADELRAALRPVFMCGRHPSWYESPLDVVEWRRQLMQLGLTGWAATGEPLRIKGPALRLVHGGGGR